MNRHWIVVASAQHVQRGRTCGFIQACHGKAGPLRRMQPGDGVICYSPTETFGGSDRLQAFTGIGTVTNDDVYQVDMGGEFHPFRRGVAYLDARAAPIRPLLNELDLTRGNCNWGSRFRFGLLPITADDFQKIAEAMNART